MKRQLTARVEYTGDRQIDALQRSSNATAQAINRSGGARVSRTEATTFTAGQTVQIFHGLDLPEVASGRESAPTGWRVVDVTGGYGSFQRTAWDRRTITIQSEFACTATFEVFAAS